LFASNITILGLRIITILNLQRSKWALAFVLFHFPRFYRAMHFSAKRGIAIACRLSVRLSVCL